METATWVCRFGSPARESQCSNAAAIRPLVVDLGDAAGAGAGEGGVLLDQVEGLGDGVLVGLADGVADPGRSSSAHSRAADLTGEKTRSKPAPPAAARPARLLSDDPGDFVLV